MNSKGILLGALRRSKGKRGLKVMSPNNSLSEGHMKKADHNLIVMTDMSKMGHEDWVVITAYYAMYQSVLSLLAKIGLESKEHATTVAVLDYFFGEQVKMEVIDKFNDVKERKDKIEAIIINEKFIDYMWKAKMARETVQYG
ncbi:HEPN domain-containing protein, partial [Candidatus Pacearchaeota archaeon]|nr:HEPN domain-containing protein [Candidatus Pacearchaeota archaeon]